MSDHSAAELCGFMFELLANDPSDEHREAAKKLWGKARSYDFSWDQMHCDEALEKLGLFRRGVHPNYPEDGERSALYGPNGDE